MKANELMIGDWVKDISQNGAYYYHQLDHSDIDHCFYRRAVYEPIPLTAKILEKNGIKKRGDEYMVFGWERAKQWYVTLEDFKPQFDFWFITSSNRGLNVRGEIRFVHEFQHALRLCGLKDLADSIII